MDKYEKYYSRCLSCCILLVPGKILKRLLEEFNNFLKSKTAVEKETTTSQEVRDLIQDLTDTLTKISEAGYRAVIVIDALNKVDESGQTTKVKNLIFHTKTILLGLTVRQFQ